MKQFHRGFYKVKATNILYIGMEELRYRQPNQIDAETLKDPVKLKAYFDWKYENFEKEYKTYQEKKRKLLKDFLNTLPPEKKENYQKRHEEYFDKIIRIHDKYDPIISKAIEDNDIAIIEKAMNEERSEHNSLEEEYKDISFML